MKALCRLFLAFQFMAGFAQTTEELVIASNEFLKSLNAKESDEVLQAFNDSLRTKWTNLPIGLAKRPGKKHGDLSDNAKIKFHELLTTIFSSQGYLKTTSIMQLDDMLNSKTRSSLDKGMIDEKMFSEIKSLHWDYDNYFISIWNEPSLIEPWGIKLEGHHLSINITIVGDHISFTPMFIGADPAVMPFTKHAGLRVLSKEEDYGLKFINSLNDEQKKKATLSKEVPRDIITNPNNTERITDYHGIRGKHLTSEQKQLLILLIKEYINNLEHNKAKQNLDSIEKSGIDNIYFAWIGSYQRKVPHYYMIHGPDFIIEYDNVGFSNNGNHIHAIWHEKNNDFGEDILRVHHLNHKH